MTHILAAFSPTPPPSLNGCDDLGLADTPRAVWGARVGQIPKAITADELAKRSKFSHVLTRLYDGRLHAL